VRQGHVYAAVTTPLAILNESTGQQSERRTDFERIGAIFRRRWWVVVLCLILGASGALGVSLLQQKQYSASASLLFRDLGFAQDLFGGAESSVTADPTREAATNEKLVGLNIISARTAKHLPGLTAKEVREMVKVEAQGEADLVEVTATSSDKAEARRVANEFARQFISFRTNADKSSLLRSKRLAEGEFKSLSAGEQKGVRGRELSSAAEKLGVLASLQTGNAELVQPAELPTSPSSPKPLRNTILGAVLGLVLGIIGAFILERLNRRLRDAEEIRDVFELPVLATIPDSKAIAAANDSNGPGDDLPSAETESFRMLRASLPYFNVDGEIRTLLITSHGAGVGKSTVAWNLARIAATSANAIVIEADLRNPTLARQHGVRSTAGLAQVLTHQVALADAIQPVSVAGGILAADGSPATLDVIVSGSVPPNPAELLESDAMKDVLAQLKDQYDLVVIDSAPIGVVADSFPLVRITDGVLLVARIGKSTKESAADVRDQLRRLEAPVLGVIANGVKTRRGDRYGYGYYGRSTSDPSVDRPTIAQVHGEDPRDTAE
jgi:succinoglycan biosynthesis transport protein ExoP